MMRLAHLIRYLMLLASALLSLLVDALHYFGLRLRSPATLAAENLFLRKQLTLYRERHVKPRRTTRATRIARSCPCRLRVIQMDLSGAGRIM